MLRLMGLPSPRRCPQVSVRRHAGGLALHFHGGDCDQPMHVDAALLGDADLEAQELRLCAALAERGYDVERLPPADVAQA